MRAPFCQVLFYDSEKAAVWNVASIQVYFNLVESSEVDVCRSQAEKNIFYWWITKIRCKAKYLKRKTPSKEGWKFPLSNSLGNVHSSVSTARVRPRTEIRSLVDILFGKGATKIVRSLTLLGGEESLMARWYFLHPWDSTFFGFLDFCFFSVTRRSRSDVRHLLSKR